MLCFFLGTDFYGADVVSIPIFEIVWYFKVAEQAYVQGCHVQFRKEKKNCVVWSIKENSDSPSVFDAVSSVLCITSAKFQLAGFCRVMDCLDNE